MLELSGSGEVSFVDEISVLVPYVAILMQTLAEAVEEFSKLRGVDFLMYRERQPLAECAFLGHSFFSFLLSLFTFHFSLYVRPTLASLPSHSREILGPFSRHFPYIAHNILA